MYLAFAAASERISWGSELLSWSDNRLILENGFILERPVACIYKDWASVGSAQ